MYWKRSSASIKNNGLLSTMIGLETLYHILSQ